MGLLPGFDPLDIPDLEAVRVQLNASPVLYGDSRDGLLILREDAAARVTRPAVTRTIEDLRDRAARTPAVLRWPGLIVPSNSSPGGMRSRDPE